MIGCYIHHQGAGHLHRTLTWARQYQQTTGQQVTGLSSVAKPDTWLGEWVQLAPDWLGWEDSDLAPAPAMPDSAATDRDPTAGGALHWAPLNHPGLRARMQQISNWIAETMPELMVVDVSVEVALLARLHGVPVVTVALPGQRSDHAHQLGFGVSRAVVGFWPPNAAGMINRVDSGPRTAAMGGISRFDSRPRTSAAPASPGQAQPLRIAALSGTGGSGVSAGAVAAVAEAFPDAQISELGAAGGSWHEDPWEVLCAADVVITAAGQNSLAEIAASRTPAVVIAADRPHEEQRFTHRVVTSGRWPAAAAPNHEDDVAGWAHAVQSALTQDGHDWFYWCDGAASARFTYLLGQLRSGFPTDRVGAG